MTRALLSALFLMLAAGPALAQVPDPAGSPPGPGRPKPSSSVPT